MKRVQKKRGPTGLRTYAKAEPPPGWNDVDAKTKAAIRTRLHQEQGGLCCYCLGQLDDSSTGSRVEHFKPKSVYASERFTWSNLFLACCGRTDEVRHCDVLKRDRELPEQLRPSRVRAHQFRFLRDGTVEHVDERMNLQINAVLGLNLDVLRARRRKVVDSVRSALVRLQRDGRWTDERLEPLIEKYRSRRPDGTYLPDCEAVIYWLRKSR